MKIALIIPFANFEYSGGISVQGRMWKKGLENYGHQVDLINNWAKYDWNSYDYIIILGCGKLLLDYVISLKKTTRSKLVSAPIIDFEGSIRKFKFRSKYYGSVKLKYNKPLHDFYSCRNKFDFFLVRSEYERRFIIDGLGMNESATRKVPISIRIKEVPNDIDYAHKENFVFHASRLGAPGKNVARLIEAAKKFDFNLVLAGTLNGKEEDWMRKLIAGYENIKCVGWISDEQLYDYYRCAKVLALPSLIEGVGMVALEAAIYGCEIVLTNLGAPKEYWNGQAVLVDPYSIDSIGQGVMEALTKRKAQPNLRDYILNNYGLDTCMRLLEQVLLENLHNERKK